MYCVVVGLLKSCGTIGYVLVVVVCGAREVPLVTVKSHVGVEVLLVLFTGIRDD